MRRGLIPSLRITDSRTQDLVARPCLFLSFSSGLLRVSFPSFGINNARWRLFCHFLSRRLFFFADRIFRVATAGDSAGDLVSLSESLLAFVDFLFVGCLCFCTVVYFPHLPALSYCIHVHMFVVSVGSVGCLFVEGGCSMRGKPITQA